MINFIKQYQSYILITVVIIAFAFWTYTSIQNENKRKPVTQPELLREQIIASITNPFPKANTLILETRTFFCGNSNPDEITITFDTYLDSNSYKNRLQQKLHIPIIKFTDFFEVMDSVANNKFQGKYPPNFWDSCKYDKVSATITAEKITSTKVSLNEYYEYNDSSKTIHKEFIFQDNNWIYNTVSASTELRIHK